jgi:hypothetical protein
MLQDADRATCLALLQVDLEVGTINDEGLRGTKAVRDMKKNQIAVHLPAHLAVELGEPEQTSEVSVAAVLLSWPIHMLLI